MTVTLHAEYPQLSLRRFINEIVDGPFGSSLTSSHYSDEGARVVRLGNIGSACFRDADAAYIPLEYYRELRRHQVSPGDLLIAGLGDERHPVGRACIAPDDIGPAIVKADCFRTRLDEGRLTHRFAAWALSSSFVSDQVVALTRGSTRSRINLDVAREIRLPIPPLEEQRRIVDFLDAETARIDKLVSAKGRASDLIDERRISLTSHLCLRGTGSDVNMRDSGIGPLGVVPAHWTITRNKDFLIEVADLSKDGAEELLTVSHLTGVTPRSEKAVYMFMAESMIGYKICHPGDLVINTLWAWMGALGVSPHQGIVSPAYGVYRFTSDEVLPDYFDRLYRTPEYVCEMTRYSKGVWTSRLRLYPESFLALSAPVPPRREQEQIVKTLERELEPEARLQEAIRRSNALLAERRQALIAAAVTGQIDVSTASGRGIED